MALGANNQYNSVPILYIPGKDVTTQYSDAGIPAYSVTSYGSQIYTGIRLENAKYTVNAQSAVSQQVLISINADGTTNKQYITDNVAPGPRTWTIGGWISSTDIQIATFTSTAIRGIDSTIRQQVKALWDFFYTRQLARFRDKDGYLWPYVAIESMELDADPLTTNKVPISITLREVNTLALDASGTTTTAISNDPVNVYTPPQDLGQMYNVLVTNQETILSGIFL